MRGFGRPVTLAASLVAAAAAFGETPPVGTGTYVASGSKVTSAIFTQFAGEDLDNYVFDGFAGQVVSVAVAAPKSSGLLPGADLIRPDGSVIGIADGAKFTPKPPAAPGRSAKIAFKLDQTGVWTVRLRGSYPGTKVKGDNPATPDVVETNFVRVEYDYDAGRTTGDYALTIKYGAPPASSWTNAVPDSTGSYRFLAPSVGGASLSGSLTFRGGTPTFTALTDPDGDAVDLPPSYVTTKPGKSITIKPYILGKRSPLGGYAFTFQAHPLTASTKVKFKSSTKVIGGERALKSRLASAEPSIDRVIPAEGGPNIPVTIECSSLSDGSSGGTPRVFLGRIEMTNVVADSQLTRVSFTTPADLPDGVFDVKVLSTSGQAAVAKAGFRVVPPPRAFTIDPVAGSSAGGFTIVITGANFSDSVNGMKVGFIDTGNVVTEPPVSVTSTESTLSFTLPDLLSDGEYRVYVKNTRTQRTAEVPFRLTLDKQAVINRIVPGLVTVLGGEQVYVNGANFFDTDHVWLETAPGSGVYEDVTASQTTYVSSTQHSFVAPVRVKGTYRLFVKDRNDHATPIREFAYYQLQDFTASLGLTGADASDGWTTALADYDLDGDEDLFVSRKGGATRASTSQTRVFSNDGDGSFTDVTATAMASPAADDDWRADRIRVADVNADAYPDIFIVTNATSLPAENTKSHLRILVSERRSSALPVGDRTFRDRTSSLMPPPRTMTVLYGGSGGVNDTDDWRGQDLWVGDVDLSNAGPPEIVVVNDEVFENYYVGCSPYCASPYSAGYTYSFYSGGTRVFKWDKSANSGLGRYKFDYNFFPRVSGITVPIFNPPPGVTVPTCSPNQCRGTFTPFTGQRLAVGALDADGKPDFAILNKNPVTRAGGQISSLQVAINRVRGGASVWDVTDDFTGLADSSYFRGDAVAIGNTGFKDVDGFGVVAFAKSDPTGLTASAMHLIRARAAALPAQDPGDFELIDESFPASNANDRFHASAIEFVDVDADGDLDMITVARTPPGGGGAAFRIFRNEVINQEPGHLTHALAGLVAPLTTATEHFEGVALTLGDVDGDGALEFLVTRDGTTGGSAPHTRAIRTDK